MTEREKMTAGMIYNSMDDQLFGDRNRAKEICAEFNALVVKDRHKAMSLLSQLFGNAGEFFIEPGFNCTYGFNISLGEKFYANFGCVILDANKVLIGTNVMFAPGVHIYTANHPVNAKERISGIESSEPVIIGDNVWIGGRSVVCPGVKIGNNTTIGAGSVVVKDIPANVVAAGSPCKVLKKLNQV